MSLACELTNEHVFLPFGLPSQHILASDLACLSSVLSWFGHLSLILHASSVVLFNSLMFLAFEHVVNVLLACCSIIFHAILALKFLQPPSFLHCSFVLRVG